MRSNVSCDVEMLGTGSTESGFKKWRPISQNFLKLSAMTEKFVGRNHLRFMRQYLKKNVSDRLERWVLSCPWKSCKNKTLE